MNLTIKSKKANGTTITSAGGAMGLVSLIVGLIILYIIFLPPDERAELLGENETIEEEEEEDVGEEDEENILLLEYPGRIDYLKEKEYEHDISPFYLSKTTNAEELDTINPFIIRHGLFDEVKKDVTFKISDLKNTDNVLLSFSAKKHSGILTIKLNEFNIFENEITTSNPKPIKIKKNYLKEDNILEFSVSGTGIKFWSTNIYSFDDMKIVGDVADISRQESKNIFFISENEKLNLERAKLRFFPNCKPDDVGKLEVLINYQEVFSGVPDCGGINVYSFSTNVLHRGDNNIVFKTDKGSYLIEQIKVQTNLRELTYPTYYFEINETAFEKIENDAYDVKLVLEFVDDKKDKIMNLNINNRMIYVDTDEANYYKNIDDYVRKGNNFIKIEPLSMLDIVELRVELEE
ncbi:MAG: hypothetical protein KKA61_00460 [Nanoarchaeota archaeon]|nr:hypothetical protein [Nanoarchaeota archaeon]